MKKSVLRVGLLVLTLALLLGALTLTAGAANPSLDVTAGETELFLDGSKPFVSTSITVQAPTGYELVGEPDFSGGIVEPFFGDYTFFADSADTYRITVTAECTRKNAPVGTDSTVELTGSCTIHVYASQEVRAEITGPKTVAAGKSISLGVEFNLSSAERYVDITWRSSDERIATVNSSSGRVTGVAAGPVTIYADLEAAPGIILEDDSLEYRVTVTGGKYTVDDPRSISLYAGHGPSAPPELTVRDENNRKVDSRYVRVEWSSRNNSYVKVDNDGKLVPLKKGSTTLDAKVTVNGETLYTDCGVEVTDDEIRFDSFELEEGDTKTLSASLKSGVKTGVTFTFESSDDDGLDVYKRYTSSNSYTAKAEECGVYTITVEATLPDGKTKLETDVDVSVYRDEDIDVTLAEADDFDFDQKDVFSAVKAGSYTYPTRDLDDLRMDELLLDGCYNFAETFTIDPVRQSNPAGSLSGISGSKRSISYLDDVSFEYDSRGGDTLVAVYEIYGDDELLLKTGTFTIRTSGTSRDITYETDNSTDVIFKEEDFEDFWERETGEDADTLDYVVFRPSSSDWGTLYTTSTKKDEVTRYLKFEPNYKTSSKNYDLDKVTYEPDEDKLTTYTDTISFTAYGTDGDTEVDGTVLIQLNSSAGTVITSRGVVFGKGNLTKLLEETFAQNRDADLAYVQFYLPDPEEGKLYYNFSKVLTSSEVDSREYYYVDPEKKQLDLDLVAFVPAAETYGKVTLYYKGFDETGDIDYNGTLTLSVKQKTSSAAFTDVNSKSYSWASDSVDFLYYEEIAQGTGGKYNPSSSITRGDFMLMLYRAFLEEAYEDYTPKNNFSDVVKGTSSYSKETYQAVGVAKYLGIAQGSGGKFKPNSPITREEAMTLIYRTLDEIDWELSYEADARASSFTDYGTISSYAKTAITDLVSHGVILGSSGKISPKSNITRAEMACILHRVLTY